MTTRTLDADLLRAAFDGPEEPTIGVEEEFFLVDPADGRPRWEAPRLCGQLADPRFKPELPAAQIEHASEPLPTLAALADALRAARSDLAAAATDVAFASAGMHPVADRVLSVPDDPRYHETLAQHPWAAHRQLVGALQVHVAVRPARIALAVADALRSHLPDLIALGAAAPFHAGEDSGLATVRPLVATLLPRQGVPPAFGSWERYAAARRWMAAAGVDDERRLWWEVRLRPEYGTVEVRAVDGQPTASQAVAVSAFVASLAVWLADRARDGEPLPVHPTERIAENRWRALRGGSRAMLADLETGEPELLHARIGRLLDAVAPAAHRMGGLDLLEGVKALLQANGADEMRAAARSRGIDGTAVWLSEAFCR